MVLSRPKEFPGCRRTKLKQADYSRVGVRHAQRMTRRSTLRVVCGLMAPAAGGAGLACSASVGPKTSLFDAGLVGDFALGSTTHLRSGHVFVVRRAEGFVALSDWCPRERCVLEWLPEMEWPSFRPISVGWFRCRCCGATFRKEDGEIEFGPSARSMDAFGLAVENGWLLVRTSVPVRRAKGVEAPVARVR